MSFGPPTTKNEIKRIASEATRLHLDHGEDLTDAVVKVASRYTVTSEHVRRICEATYHDMFDQLYKQADGDKFVSFDPPDTERAIEQLRATKLASIQARTTRGVPMGPSAEKVASAGSGLRRFTPANAFVSAVRSEPQDLPLADPLRELREQVEATKEAAVSVLAQLRGAEGEERVRAFELFGLSKQAARDGATLNEILHMGSEALSQETSLQPFIVHEVLGDVAQVLLDDGVAAEGEKTARKVNSNHPLFPAFVKLAAIRQERLHLEIGLRELETNREKANDQLREALSK